MDSNFFKQLFTSLSSEDSWTVLGMLLISFLIGLITNYFLNRRRVKDLEMELEKSERDKAHVKNLMATLEEQHALQGADLKKASLELVDKSKSLEVIEAEKRTLNSRLSATLVDLDKSKEEFRENTNRLEDLNDQILGLRTKNAQLSTELEQSNTVNAQYSLTQGTAVEDPETKQKIANLMAENSLLKGSIDELKSGTSPEGTAAASIRITELEAENEALKSNLTINNPGTTGLGIVSDGYESSEAYAAMEAKIAELEAEKEKLEDSLAEVTQLEDGNEALNVTVRSLMEENEELKDKLDELPQLEGGNDALNNTIRTLMEENEELKDKLDELPQYESGNDVLTSSMNTLVGENEDLQGDAEKLIQYEAGNEILNKTITDLISKNEALEEELNNAANNNSPLEWSVGANGNQEIVEEEEEEEISPEEAQAKFRSAIGTQIAMASKDERDDLKQINGIGPFIEEKLNDLGIYTFEQVSQLDEDLIVTLTAAIEFFPGRIERDEWVGQADRLYYTKGNTPQEMTNTSKIVTRRYATATEKIIVEPRTTPKPAVAATARVRTERDDLKKIEGIGPKISAILNKGGILTFSGLAATPVDRLKRILADAGNRYKMHNPATWPEQAKLAAEGQWEKLKELQDYLDGGRDVAKG